MTGPTRKQTGALNAKVAQWTRLNSFTEESRVISDEREMIGNRLHFRILIASQHQETRVEGSIGPRGGTQFTAFQRRRIRNTPPDTP